MQIASSIATKDFAGYFEQAVFQPALHSRILQKKRPHLHVQAFFKCAVCNVSGFAAMCNEE